MEHQMKGLKEVVTPYKISLLVLILEYNKRRCEQRKQPIKLFAVKCEEEKLSTPKLTQKQMRDFMMLVLKLLQSPDLEMREFLDVVKLILDTELYNAVTLRLETLYKDNSDAIMDFFQSLSDVLSEEAEQKITKTSVLGLFIRRMILAFDRLTFSQVVNLSEKHGDYYTTGKRATPPSANTDLYNSLQELSMMEEMGGSEEDMFSKHKSVLSKSFEKLNLNNGSLGHISGVYYSPKQAEYFITQQGFLVQYNENEALAPQKLQEKIAEMLITNPDLTEAHFLSFLNNLRVKEFCSTVHALHHYFDHHMISHTTAANQSSKTREDNASRRYAALNLAGLYYRFGHKEEALAALREAIRIARETNDHVCLQHALGWLYRLEEPGSEQTASLMERSIARSSELNLPYLTSLGVQAFARHNAFTNSTPASVFDSLLKSDILNCQHSQAGFMCVSYAQKAALWDMYGMSENCSMCSQLVLNLDTSDCGIYNNGESTCIALCNLAKHHADRGLYGAAFDILMNAKKLFPSTSQHANIWMFCEQSITFERAINCSKWQLAEQAIQNLMAVNQSEADIRQALLLKEKGDPDTSLRICQKLLEKCQSKKQKGDFSPDFRVRVLLEIADVFCRTRNHTQAMPHLLECVTWSRTHHLSYLLALANVYLAHVQMFLLLPGKALQLLDEYMPTILIHGSLMDQARVQLLYAKCQVAVAMSTATEQTQTMELLGACNMITSAREAFEKIEAQHRLKDLLYYQARLYDKLGYTSERNKCAQQFKQLDKQNPSLLAISVNIV